MKGADADTVTGGDHAVLVLFFRFCTVIVVGDGNKIFLVDEEPQT